MRVIVADDDPTVRLILKRVLISNLHCIVIEAIDGQHVLDVIAREHASLLVLDLVMPKVGGIEVLEAVRKQPRVQHLPVVVLTGDREEATVKRILALGVEDYLTKPIDLNLAAARLARVLARIRSRTPPRGRDGMDGVSIGT